MKINKQFSTVNNESGVAIIMVLSAIVLLTTIMTNFSFDGNVNRIKAYNIENKGQAKLTAESGLQFAMVRLKLYQEAFNYLEKNISAKEFAPPEVLNSIWNFPFIYPIPITSQMNQTQKESIRKFSENVFLKGSLKLTISNLSQKINLNLLRVSLLAQAIDAQESTSETDNQSANEEDQEYNVENQIFNNLRYSIERKSEKDELFQNKYYGTDPRVLTNTLKVYISDPNSLNDDGGAAQEFDKINITPKKAPISSFSEIYTLPGWDDELVELIKGEFTVYGALLIDLNRITDKMLRLLIPTITDEEVKEFFEYRDNPEDPKFFNKSEDFKNYIVKIGNVLNNDEYDERIAKFEAQGLKFGPTPTLFKVISVGIEGRATYTLTAYISLPTKPIVKPKPITTNTTEESENERINDSESSNTEENDTNSTETVEETEQPTQLLSPRILEIFIS